MAHDFDFSLHFCDLVLTFNEVFGVEIALASHGLVNRLSFFQSFLKFTNFLSRVEHDHFAYFELFLFAHKFKPRLPGLVDVAIAVFLERVDKFTGFGSLVLVAHNLLLQVALRLVGKLNHGDLLLRCACGFDKVFLRNVSLTSQRIHLFMRGIEIAACCFKVLRQIVVCALQLVPLYFCFQFGFFDSFDPLLQGVPHPRYASVLLLILGQLLLPTLDFPCLLLVLAQQPRSSEHLLIVLLLQPCKPCTHILLVFFTLLNASTLVLACLLKLGDRFTQRADIRNLCCHFIVFVRASFVSLLERCFKFFPSTSFAVKLRFFGSEKVFERQQLFSNGPSVRD
ncbi:hypothetical protein BDZ88DRAFT_425195 [Geranomyces variabilis]|nr:hypothetical protein BDZ88DRAFT_425195 [Geranomyces variabilis]